MVRCLVLVLTRRDIGTGKFMALPESILLSTRLGREIPNFQDLDQPPGIAARLVEGHRRNHPMATMRRAPTGLYNCHGLTFACRRTGIYNPEDIEKILKDDGYRQIKPMEAQPGDIVVYRDGRETSHTAAVIQVERSNTLVGGQAIWVLSKWGQGAEYIHVVKDDPYKDHDVTFWTERPTL